MPYITSVERSGRKQGMREGLLEGIKLVLDLKFGSEGLATLPEIFGLQDVEQLRAILAPSKNLMIQQISSKQSTRVVPGYQSSQVATVLHQAEIRCNCTKLLITGTSSIGD